jgi:hypothetical protein
LYQLNIESADFLYFDSGQTCCLKAHRPFQKTSLLLLAAGLRGGIQGRSRNINRPQIPLGGVIASWASPETNAPPQALFDCPLEQISSIDHRTFRHCAKKE